MRVREWRRLKRIPPYATASLTATKPESESKSGFDEGVNGASFCQICKSFCHAANFDFQHMSWEASESLISHRQFSSYKRGGTEIQHVRRDRGSYNPKRGESQGYLGIGKKYKGSIFLLRPV